MNHAPRFHTAALALALLLPTTASARAEEQAPRPEVRAQALEKAQEGLAHYRAERWREACDSFREAERLFAAPSVMIYLARCQGKLGNTAEARRLYERILAAPPAKDAPAPYVEAYRDAERELAALPAAVEPPRQAVAAPPPSPPPPSGGSLIPGLITIGVGAAGLGIGAVTGALSLSRVSDLQARCGGYHCRPADEGDARSAKTLGNLSTAAFVVGGVAAAAGVVLLVIRPGGAQATSAPSARAPAAAVSGFSVGVGVGRIQLEAKF
jgi:tetratricopeptide (TPR) repeat protein